MDLQNPAGIQEAGRTSCSPDADRGTRAALDRLETSLALVEGWVDLVTEQATSAHPPRRPRARRGAAPRPVGGPQKTFSGLVGLELRPPSQGRQEPLGRSGERRRRRVP